MKRFSRAFRLVVLKVKLELLYGAKNASWAMRR